ncbi:MAG: KH domain-containing protein [Clostridia bacterium]|nr:KH domain-containing protein [Clostridia bacterium]
MEELVKYIVSHLLDESSDFEVTSNVEGDITVINVIVGAGDIGKVIGKQGRIAKAIRMLVKASSKDSGKYAVDIIER